jgi:hypothetical protein
MDTTIRNWRFAIVTLLICSCSPRVNIKSNDSKSIIGKKLSLQRELLRDYALCACLRFGYKDSEVYSDISTPILLNQMLYSSFITDLIKEKSKKYAGNIKGSEVADYNNKRPIIVDCLKYYRSSSLDSLIRSFDSEL